MYAHLRGTSIYFDVVGPGLDEDGPAYRERPVAFVVHGGPGGDHSGMRAAFAPLTEYLQLVFFDHRGQGRSARGVQSSYTLDNNVDDMEALRVHLGLGPIIVIGVSYGGMVALTYAARYPSAVAALLPIVTTAHHGFLARAQEILAERGTPEQIRVCERLWNGNFKTVEQMREYFAVTGPLYSTTYNPAAATVGFSRAIYSPAAINQGFGGFLKTYDVRADLPNINTPTLDIGGGRDWICAPEFSVEIAQAIPGADLLILPESSHRVWADQPAEFYRALAAFFARWFPDTAAAAYR